MDALLISIAFSASLLALHSSGFRLLGVNAHPLAFLIWIQIFVLTLIGTLGLGVFGLPMAYGADAAISEETRSEVIFLTFWSVIVFFLGLACLFALKILKPLNYQVRKGDYELLNKLTVTSVIIIFVKLLFVSEIPLLLVFSGDLLAATEAKIRILTKQTGITIFGFNYIVRSFPSYIYIASILVYVSDKTNKKYRNLFMVNLLLATIDSLYDVQKQAIVVLALATFWIFYIQKGKIMALLKGAAIASVLSGAMFVLTLDYSSGQAILDDTVNRIFLAQAEGMFFIRELIDPAIKYMWLGFPLAGLFGFEQLDPAAEVIPILFPTVSDSWLNSNTYYITHAWSIFGNWAVILGPFFVLVNVMVVLFVAQPLIKTRSIMYYAVVFWVIVKMPVVNIFTEFLWMKIVLDAFINIAFISILILMFKPRLNLDMVTRATKLRVSPASGYFKRLNR